MIRRFAPHPFGAAPKGALSPLRGGATDRYGPNGISVNLGGQGGIARGYAARPSRGARDRRCEAPRRPAPPMRRLVEPWGSNPTPRVYLSDGGVDQSALTRRYYGGQGGIRTHEHLLGCYSLSRRAPSTTRPPVHKPFPPCTAAFDWHVDFRLEPQPVAWPRARQMLPTPRTAGPQGYRRRPQRSNGTQWSGRGARPASAHAINPGSGLPPCWWEPGCNAAAGPSRHRSAPEAGAQAQR